MKADSVLKRARKISGLSQREVSERSGIAQPVIARIEAGRASPRTDTFDKLLAACGFDLTLVTRAGRAIDRGQIRKLAQSTPTERLRAAVREVGLLRALADGRVRFLVIGGTAGRLWGSPTPVNDLDICYARDDQNLRRLAMVLQTLQARLRGVDADVQFQLDERALSAANRLELTTSAGNLTLLGKGFDQLLRTAARIEMEELRINVASLEDLMEMRRAAGTLEDRAELEVLGALLDERDSGQR